jgi:hypothetical protein
MTFFVILITNPWLQWIKGRRIRPLLILQTPISAQSCSVRVDLAFTYYLLFSSYITHGPHFRNRSDSQYAPTNPTSCCQSFTQFHSRRQNGGNCGGHAAIGARAGRLRGSRYHFSGKHETDPRKDRYVSISSHRNIQDLTDCHWTQCRGWPAPTGGTQTILGQMGERTQKG